ncbi:MAG TPA: 30S ribosomal protein S16 [Deltaproteobacteria bacterium]|nr:MAG: 30S ribosomal protein S16 [Deltaproteobacteria bacterium GWA2_45_12]HBF12381.1 30S ribosomal protein S16 [Deltaproteobacteria bacterium]
MAVVIRLARHGKKKHPFYRVVAADQNFPRDGRFLEVLGTYNPKHPQAKGTINKERLQHWISHGAKPSALVKQLVDRTLGDENKAA